MGRALWILRSASALLAVTLPMMAAWAQDPSSSRSGLSAMPQNVEDVLHQMSDKADVIFIGQVLAIRPHDDGGTTAGYVEIDFRVDQAIRGCTVGAYALREWAGLWSGDARRYQAGQRLLMMLHAPGVGGLSSPVGGMDGAIPIRGEANTSPLAEAAAVTTPPVPEVDLRWLGAKVAHPVSYLLQPILSPTPLTVGEQTAPASNLIASPTVPQGDGSSRASIPGQQASVDTVVQLLSSWKEATDDVR
jgi:hypothetical protein